MPKRNDDLCPYCGADESWSSHYHCANCGEESSMMGHWDYRIGKFDCEPKEGWGLPKKRNRKRKAGIDNPD